MISKPPTLTDSNNIADLEAAANHYASASLSENSIRGYASDWTDFEYWCKRTNNNSLPATPKTIALYLTKMSQHLKVSSLRRRITAIRKAHELSNYSSPTKDERVRSVFRGILRTKGEAQKHAAPTLIKHIQLIMESLPDTNKGIRDRALLLLGFAGGFRRSELVGIDVEDLTISDEGIVVRIKRSKTDQTGRGKNVPISYGSNKKTCPVYAIRDWLQISGKTKGALFCPIDQWGYLSPTRLTDQSVRSILLDSLTKASINPKDFSGHSLRAGFVTVSYINGTSEEAIQRTTGHTNLNVLRRYKRDADIFRNNASKKLGL